MPARLSRSLFALWLAALALLAPLAAWAQPTFPALTGRVVDGANIIPADEKARLEQKLAALEQQSKRQLVVATLPSLQGYDIADYGYQLGRAWGIGQKDTNNGALLIIAPTERKVRIEVGYGLEGVLTDGLSALIIQQQVVPRFKAGDMAGGIEAGADAIIQQLTLPPEEAQKIAAEAQKQASTQGQRGVDPGMVIFVIFVMIFFVLPMLRGALGGGRRYRSGAGALGPLIVFDALSHMSGRRGGGWGGGSDWGGGGGGFSGGGGSFGGGGASGSW
ncbi:TPM domain-containing protein [Novosphingobium flavum]|uniref:TPM domain-containing protein n=1 Tax=Novosphingobium flavum TaxID=1778672 RepID=A0A7X1FTF0_9SPHN|nr:TPM domain-containing protein [Novosphingobium flavum]MBC2666623.1 TPM domain-containing protein [Novosphingobium flavum]